MNRFKVRATTCEGELGETWRAWDVIAHYEGRPFPVCVDTLVEWTKARDLADLMARTTVELLDKPTPKTEIPTPEDYCLSGPLIVEDLASSGDVELRDNPNHSIVIHPQELKPLALDLLARHYEKVRNEDQHHRRG